MNKRMLELAKEAEWSANRGDDVDVVVMMEKFAELIVRECADLVQGVTTDTMGYHSADQKIKQHFGVE